MSQPLFYTPTPPGVIGAHKPPFVHQVTVDRAVLSFLQRWLPTYLSEAERREGKPTRWLARPSVFTTTYDEDDEDFYSDARLPTVIVTAGEASDWERDGDGRYAVTYRTAISVVSRGRSMPEARLQSSLYCAAVTQLMLDKPSLDGFAGGVEPISERPRPLIDPTNRSRNLSAGMGTYGIWVPFVRQALTGPNLPEPPHDPDAVWPPTSIVSDVDVEVEGEAPGGEPSDTP